MVRAKGISESRFCVGSRISTVLRRALVAPSLIDLEVVSVLRRKRLQGRLDEHRAGQAVVDLHDLYAWRERPSGLCSGASGSYDTT